MPTYPAPAKLNLFLHVVGQRPDGYHLLQTVFRFIDYGDSLSFAVRDDGLIRRLNPLPGLEPEQDLTVRAARLLQQAGGCRLGVDIALEKRLPMGGGLGGGSSDAATVLLALNRLWDLNLGRTELQALGLRLGADVPVFLFGESAFAEGIGEKLQPVALPSAWYVVLVPPVAVSTPEIFASRELTRDTKPIKMSDFSTGCGRNDLESVVCRNYPQVAESLAWLRGFGDARMTGSGACVFAGFSDEEQARRVFSLKPAKMAGFVAKGLDRHPLYDFAS
ncbi:MAG: 4-(cytidine 5'-diphospho)-2-C-methyl-D-erythritol kinase [Betaproteobacteria bacterium]|nr:4-(cytidine 5'-diphospho)-2-C-methyl-D-erythritol kinase [Betaproteobacteria bacterium]